MKSKKTALLKSVLSLILCVSMLLGSTFAWFTDTVTSENNIIQSGSLKAAMSWKNPGETVWKDASTGAIFNYEYWEPGYVDAKHLKLENIGNLAFQYRLFVVPNNDAVDMKLAEVLDVYVSDTEISDRTDVAGMQRLGTLKELLTNPNGVQSGILLPEANKRAPEVDVPSAAHAVGSATVCIAIKMQESAGNDYMGLKLGDGFKVQLLASQYTYEKDSFGSNYDTDSVWPEGGYTSSGSSPALPGITSVSGTAPVTLKADNTLAAATTITTNDPDVFANLPENVKMVDGATSASLNRDPKTTSDSNIVAGDGETVIPLDVHIDGVHPDNQIAIPVSLGDVLPEGLNLGNMTLYHVENGQTKPMTRVLTLDELTEHNQFYYNPETGRVFVSMAAFSEVALVAEEAKWEGKFDYSWYAMRTGDEYTIANADQLAAFGAIVGGMAEGIEQDSFSGKTVKLIADINLGDDEENNNPDLIFYPIGYNSSDGKYEKTDVAVTTGFYNFAGTFDGNGHTIANFYQNTWEMKGDNEYYDASEQRYRDGMGLFGRVYGGTVKNLTVKNFSSDGEYTTTGTIAAYADGATFENITIFNCNPRVYNIGNGGIVGCVGWYAKDEGLKTTFKNITVDNSNKISALWGSWDVACGGLVGQYYPTSGQTSANKPANGGIEMVNCHVAAQIDVYNDVCANYQYYAYRYAGMLIGSVRENVTIDGHSYPKMDGITAKDCTVHFGTWNDYYYCELVANTTASYTHDHQMSRLTEIKAINGTTITYLDGTTSTVPASGRANYVIVDYTKGHGTENATCYHFLDGEVWNHEDGGKETVNGVEVLKEDKQHIYLEFNNLVTGYGWGVTSRGFDNLDGVTNLDISQGDHEASVEKFVGKQVNLSGIKAGDSISVGTLFKAIDGAEIINDTVMVSVTDLTKTGITADFVPGATWDAGTLTFNGTNGIVKITIQDYYFCTPTSITVTVGTFNTTNRFAVQFPNTGKYLYRVGNKNAVSISSLFGLQDSVEASDIGKIDVVVEDLQGNKLSVYTAGTGAWNTGKIDFADDYSGPVVVTISDDKYSTPVTLYLEVVNAKNITKAESATANDVVLLNDISGTFVVSNGHTFYGNGFTVTLPTSSVKNIGNGFTGYISIGASQDDGIANGGNLDNVRIEGPVYPEMYIYRDQAKITNKSDPDYGDGYNMRYFVNSVIVYGGNVTISNSYISGSRTALCLRAGNNVVIENTTLSGGAYANMEICAGNSVTLRNLTTVQVDVADSYGKGKTAHGMGIAVDSDVVNVYIEGELNQYNWLNEEKWINQVPSAYQSKFPDFFDPDAGYTKHWHYLNGNTSDPYVNLAFIYACNWDSKQVVANDKRTVKDYATTAATINDVKGGVYSKTNTVGGDAITPEDLAGPVYKSTGFNPVAPTLNFDNTPNADADDANDANDTYCVYNESTGTLKIGVSGDSKTIDLSKVAISKDGTNLDYTAYLNGTKITGNSVTIKAADGAKQTLTFEATSKDAGYDKDGKPIAGSIEYTWTVTVEIAVLAYPAPDWNMGGDYEFDRTNCYYAYYKKTQGYGEAVPIYEGIKINYYNKTGELVALDLSGTTTHPTGSNNSNSNAFTYTLSDGATLTMKFSSGWKSGATTHQFTTYSNKVYIYPQSLDNDNYVRSKTTNQDFDVKISYTFTDPNGQSISQTMRWYNAKDSNGKVGTVQWKDFDSTNGKTSGCVTGDTLVTLADGGQKRIDEVTDSDELLVWDFYNGCYTTTKATVVFNHGLDTYSVIKLKFSDGTILKMVEEHEIFDVSANSFVYIHADTVAEYIGHSFVKAEGDSYTTVELVDYDVTVEQVEAYTILTAVHFNAILEGMFTLTPDPTNKCDMYFRRYIVGEGMKFDEQLMQADIEKYGLYTHADFAEYVTYEEFVAFDGGYLKILVGKGYIVYEDILNAVANYAPNH